MRINTNLIISLTCSQQLKQIIRRTCSFGFWWHHNPEQQHSHPHGCQNLKSYKHTNRLYFLNSYASVFFTFSCTLRLWNTELMLFLFLNTIWKWAVLLMFQKSLFSPLSRWNDFLLALANTYVQVHHLSVSRTRYDGFPFKMKTAKTSRTLTIQPISTLSHRPETGLKLEIIYETQCYQFYQIFTKLECMYIH